MSAMIESGASPADALAADEARAIAKEAYIYGSPMVDKRLAFTWLDAATIIKDRYIGI